MLNPIHYPSHTISHSLAAVARTANVGLFYHLKKEQIGPKFPQIDFVGPGGDEVKADYRINPVFVDDFAKTFQAKLSCVLPHFSLTSFPT